MAHPIASGQYGIWHSLLFGILAIAISVALQQNTSIRSIVQIYNPFKEQHYVCEDHYSTEIISLDPLTIYINKFVTQYEMDYLLTLSSEYNYTYPQSINASAQRTSSYVVLPTALESDPLVSCLTSRAENLQHHLGIGGIEQFQIVRYLPGEKHPMHYDWFPDDELESNGFCQRLTSMFVYLAPEHMDKGEEELVGGETYFPELPSVSDDADGAKFARPGNGGKGLIVRPVAGNALFWVNLKDGKGDERTAHTGLEIVEGVKRGMNILGHIC